MAPLRILGVLLSGALLLPGPSFAQTTLSVQASGELPGFRIEDASSYLAGEMTKAGIAAWRFAPRVPSVAAPDRIEWDFQLQPYAGGQVRQLFPMAGVQRMLGPHRLVSAQVKLFLAGQYQTVIIGQEAVQGGAGDPELSALIARLTRTLYSGYAATEAAAIPHHAP
jgi:hypothetical protein